MGTRIYGPTSIGPNCRIGGEVSNCASWDTVTKDTMDFWAPVIGKRCNRRRHQFQTLGALQRRRGMATATYVDSGLQFCGVLMATTANGINTMFNTGTVVGAGCNIFGGGFQPGTFLLAWGGNDTWDLHALQIHRHRPTRHGTPGSNAEEEEINQWRTQHEAARTRFD